MTEPKSAREHPEQFPPVGHSAPPKDVVEALARVMEEMPAISKGGRASDQQGGYSYRGIEQITAECQRLFGKYGIVFVPRITGTEIVPVTVGTKPWSDTRLMVEYDIHGPNGSKVTVGPILGVGRDGTDKGSNKALTQTFKYALLQVLCVSDKRDDADGSGSEADTTPVEALESHDGSSTTGGQRRELRAKADRAGKDIADLVEFHLPGVKPQDLTYGQAEFILDQQD